MMPDLPSLHAIAVMIITIIGLYLFSRDSIPIETSGLIIFITILSMFYLFPLQESEFPSDPVSLFLNSFGNEALVTICALLAVGKAIEINGKKITLKENIVKMRDVYKKQPPNYFAVYASSERLFKKMANSTQNKTKFPKLLNLTSILAL